MKKFFNAIFLLSMLAVFVLPSSAFAEKNFVPVYNRGVDEFIGTLNNFGNQMNVFFKGKNYRTTDTGLKICDVNFNDSQDNLLSLCVNDSDTIDYLMISFPGDSETSTHTGGMVLGFVLVAVGLNEQECTDFLNQLAEDIDLANKQNSDSFEKTYTVYSSALAHTVVIDTDFSESACQVLIDAYSE